jgi:AcrR family transcriptional regulator
LGVKLITLSDKRELVLNAAIRLFTRQGFRKTSVDEIAHLARVSKATIYQIFNDKTSLLGEVYQRKSNELKEKMEQAVVPGGPIIPQLLNMLNFARDFYSKDPLLCRFLEQREIEEIEAAPQFNEIANSAVTLIEDLLSEGIKRGEIRPLPTKMAAYFCFRIGFYLTQYGSELFAQFSPEEVSELFYSVLTRGIVSGKL